MCLVLSFYFGPDAQDVQSFVFVKQKEQPMCRAIETTLKTWTARMYSIFWQKTPALCALHAEQNSCYLDIQLINYV